MTTPIAIVLLCLALAWAISFTFVAQTRLADKRYWEERANTYRNRMNDAHAEADRLQRLLDDELRLHQMDLAELRKLEEAVAAKLANPRVSWSKVADQLARLRVADGGDDES